MNTWHAEPLWQWWQEQMEPPPIPEPPPAPAPTPELTAPTDEARVLQHFVTSLVPGPPRAHRPERRPWHQQSRWVRRTGR